MYVSHKINNASVPKTTACVCGGGGSGAVYVNKIMLLKALNSIGSFAMILWLHISRSVIKELRKEADEILFVNKYFQNIFHKGVESSTVIEYQDLEDLRKWRSSIINHNCEMRFLNGLSSFTCVCTCVCCYV